MSKIFKRIGYLKSKQDHTIKNFGMVGMGYVVEVLNEYEAENTKLESDLARVTELLRESVKVIEFYGDGVELNWDTDDIREEEDSSFDEERQMSFKGKRAREFLAKPEIKEVLK